MSSFWGSQSKEEEKKTPVEKQKKSKTAIAVAEDDKKQEKKQEKKEEPAPEEPKEEEKEDKKTPLFEKKPEVQMQRFGELPDGVIESTSVQTKIKFADVETRKFMHLNLDDLLKLDENCAVKIRGIKFSITNWNELKCQSTHLAYTNTPLVDAEIADWCVEDFTKTFKTENKIDEFYIEEPKCVWTLKSETELVDTNIFQSLVPDEKKIVKSDQQIASEVLYLRGKEMPFSLGTCMFSLKRMYEGDICLCVDVSVLYEKNPF